MGVILTLRKKIKLLDAGKAFRIKKEYLLAV